MATRGPDAASISLLCLRHRRIVVASWIVAIAAGALGGFRLSHLLGDSFSVPGTDSNHVEQMLARRHSEQDALVLVAPPPAALDHARRAAQRAAEFLPHGRVDGIATLHSGAAVAFVSSSLRANAAASRTMELRRLLGPRVDVTGSAALQHDVGVALGRDLRVGDLYLALPISLTILVLAFGTASAVLPLLFAAATIPPALGISWALAHVLELSDYLPNMVTLIGAGIAIDYSLLMVTRYREERLRGRGHDVAVQATMQSAGRTVVVSALAVALGLGVMTSLPVPFLRGLGVGGLLVPVVSAGCALTLFPIALSLAGERLERIRILPRPVTDRRVSAEARFWSALALWVIAHAKVLAPLAVAVLVVAALPLIEMRVGSASTEALPATMPAMKGLSILERSKGGGVLDPITVIVETSSVRGTADALSRLRAAVVVNPEVVEVTPVRRTAADASFQIVGRHDPASDQAQSFAELLRSRLVPDARFPRSTRVLVGGGGASAVDFVSRTLGPFPWIVLALVASTYVLLLRAFRSLLLPLKAIALNLLTVAAASGLTIAVFQWGWGRRVGFLQIGQLEGWIPIFMFALLFGLSMDYEVFLVHRMRESWERHASTARAVVHGLTNTGKVVTAAGLIMSATFGGLIAGTLGTMQQIGFALVAAVLIDITLVRMVLLPSLMIVAGRWNWYLPVWTARMLRLPA
jgi:RND superfamily putative drug exporter